MGLESHCPEPSVVFGEHEVKRTHGFPDGSNESSGQHRDALGVSKNGDQATWFWIAFC